MRSSKVVKAVWRPPRLERSVWTRSDGPYQDLREPLSPTQSAFVLARILTSYMHAGICMLRECSVEGGSMESIDRACAKHSRRVRATIPRWVGALVVALAPLPATAADLPGVGDAPPLAPAPSKDFIFQWLLMA